MTEKERNDYFYVCALIEYIARETKNHRGDIVNQIGEDGIKKLLYDAEVDHCLSFEQVSDEVVDYYKIKQGDFDTISACKYSIPSFLDIGKLYSIMIEDCAKPGDEVSELMKIFSSFISDEISNFNTDLYKNINVVSVQTEVDAGFEGRNKIALIEAKNSNTKNIIIRQLYYPM